MRIDVSERDNLPLGWRWVRLGQVIRDAQPGFASGKRDAGGVVQLRMNNVTNLGRFDWSALTRVPADAALVETFTLKPGDVLFNNTNSVELVGKSALFQGFEEPVVFSNHFTRIRTHETELVPEFLAAWLQERWHSRLFSRICQRWVGQAAVQREKLLDLRIALPDVSEQRRIAAALGEQMAAGKLALTAAEAQLEATNGLAAAHCRDIFSTPMAGSWSRRRLGDLLAQPVKTGISKPLSPAADKRCLTLSAVRDGVLDLSASKPVAVSDADAEGNWVMPGAFYVVRGNGQLRRVARGALAPAMVDQPALYPDLLFQVVTDPEQVDSLYLRFVWETDAVRADIERKARTSAGIFKINQANLREIALPLPPLEEQRRIARTLAGHIRNWERLRETVQARLANIESLPAALLRRAFSGGL